MSALAGRPSTFAAATHWIQGESFDRAVAAWVADRRWILVTSSGWRRRGAVERLEALLGSPSAAFDNVPPNPQAQLLLDRAPAATATIVVALGGGSVIDYAKGVAALHPIARDRRRHLLLSHLRDGEPWPREPEPLPIVAVPTTTGTGSEVTPWGTLWDGSRKTSIVDQRLRPIAAVLDPELPMTMPRSLALATSLDALTHAFEAIWNRAHTPLTDALASQAIQLLYRDLAHHLTAPVDLDRVARLQVAAALAGQAMNGTRTALAHSISYALTARWQLAHGLGCGLVLGELARTVAAKRPGRLEPAARALGVAAEQVADTLDAWLESLGLGPELVRLPADAVELCRGDLLHPARAGNFLFQVDTEAAAGLLGKALARHQPTVYLEDQQTTESLRR